MTPANVPHPVAERTVQVPVGSVLLEGTLTVPDQPMGIVVFAHGSGSSRHSPRNRAVAGGLQRAGLATFLLDLLDPREEREDVATAHLRFDIGLLAARVLGATDWLVGEMSGGKLAGHEALRIGYFGASTGAAAALVAAAQRPDVVCAVVSRGGRPDLAADALAGVQAPTLLIVGGDDVPVIGLNEQALARLAHLGDRAHLEIVPGATHLFEEPGALEQVAHLAQTWFRRYLAQREPGSP